MIVIVEYGMGNVGSILSMYKKIGAPARVASEPGALEGADRLILPGVGAFDAAVEAIESRGFRPALERKVIGERIPILGICLGMQLLTRGSEEGGRPGLGWLDADTVRFSFPSDQALRIPHMGWNSVTPRRTGVLFPESGEALRFYFVHSFHVRCDRPEDVLAETHYGYAFPCAVQRGIICGVQFHPEKSHKFGLRLLERFAAFPC